MISNPVVLITGATGFIGQHLCRALSEKKIKVIALSLSPYLCDDLRVTEKYVLDLKDREKIFSLISEIKPNYVVHLAGVRCSDYRVAYEENLISALNVTHACQEILEFKKFIFLGSCEEYGQQKPPFKENSQTIPTSAYGLSKLATTQFLQSIAEIYHFPVVILRPSVVYGPGQRLNMFLPSMIQSLLLGDRFAMTQGEQCRDYLYVSDLVEAIEKALLSDEKVNGKIINVSSGLPIRIRQLACLTASLIDSKAVDKLDFGVKPCRLGEAMEYWADNKRAKVLLNWSSRTSLEEGLLETIVYFKKYIQQNLAY